MANHQSTKKRIRTNQTKRLRNRYQWKSCKTAIKNLMQVKEREQAEPLLRVVTTMIDKAAGRHLIHQNKAAHTKSMLAKRVQAL